MPTAGAILKAALKKIIDLRQTALADTDSVFKNILSYGHSLEDVLSAASQTAFPAAQPKFPAEFPRLLDQIFKLGIRRAHCFLNRAESNPRKIRETVRFAHVRE